MKLQHASFSVTKRWRSSVSVGPKFSAGFHGSKMFCGCQARWFGAPPNTLVCPVCLGLPGALPVPNRRAIELAITAGLALHCETPDHTKFDRKNYPYPDLVKGYQISQYDMPLCTRGYLDYDHDGERYRCRITRVHLEEDTAKLIHKTGTRGEAVSLVDLNRSGVPLMEIVGEPDLRSPGQARAYSERMRSLRVSIGACDGNNDEGSLRVDVNVSPRREG